MKLDKEERDILKSFERGEWRSSSTLSKDKARFREYARATLRKDSRVNIRISRKDLTFLQRKALYEGLPYQTFISSLLHKFASGRLAEKHA
jgi:predicted DNA binding CopG/RHH family protein